MTILCKFLATLFFLLVDRIAFAAQHSFEEADIRKVDFYNFTYQPECNGGKPVPVRNGAFQTVIKKQNPSEDYISFKIDKIVFGDLTGDGYEEAVVLTLCHTGGSATFFDAVIYSMRDGHPATLIQIQGGAGADGGIVGVAIKGGLITIDRAKSNVNCTQDFMVETTRYRLDGTRLLQAGKTEQRKPSSKEKTRFCR